jgi:shikimate kinase
MKNIVIIGFMATGKSTVGRRLAHRLGRAFIDTDKEIEAVTGKTVAQIFARDGAVRFRSEEALLVKKLSAREDLVIATGGGIVLDPENVRLLKESGILIALSASPDVIYQRARGKKTRPLLAKVTSGKR